MNINKGINNMAKKEFSLKYKLREGDNYENLASRFGTTVLSNAGIYGDEDLKKDQEYNFNVGTREEAELIQKKDLDYQKQNNAAVRQRNTTKFDDFWKEHGNDFMAQYGRDLSPENATKFKDRIRREYISGSNSIQNLHDKAARIQKEFWDGTFSNATAKQDMLHNAREIQKNPVGANLRTIGYDNSGLQTKGQSDIEKELGRSLTESERKQVASHYDDYQNFRKLGKGNSYQDYLRYLDSEHRSAQSTRDLTRDIATGITLGASGLGAAQTLVSSGAQLMPSFVKNIGKDMLLHPIENFVAPQVISQGAEKAIDYSNAKGWTNINDSEKELLSTTIGFSTGKFGVDFARDKISKGLVKAGKGYLYDSGSKVGDVLSHQLKNKYTSLHGVRFKTPTSFNVKDPETRKELIKQAKNLGTWAGTNFVTYGVPEIVPGAGQYISHKTTGKSLGENLEQYTGINSTIGDMLFEGALSSGADAYKHGLEYTKASMSGGKKGFSENWKYLTTQAGRTDNDYKFAQKHPVLGKLNAIRRMIMLEPGNNYQMATIESFGKGHGSTKYTPYAEGDVSPVKFVKHWFSGDEQDLAGKLQKSGSVMIGDGDATKGNTLEKLTKGWGTQNDGRFEVGQRTNIVTTPGTEEVLNTADFYNMRTGKYEPLFVNGEINPNFNSGTYSSRNNVLLDPTKTNAGGYKGTMLDIDGHSEVKIRTKDGKFGYLHRDLIGPGSGGTGGGVMTRILSNLNSREAVPTYSITLSGNRRLFGNTDKNGLRGVTKIMHPEFSDTDDFVLTLENMGDANIKARFGQKDENGEYINDAYKKISEYKANTDAEIKKGKANVERFRKGELDESQKKWLDRKITNAKKKQYDIDTGQTEAPVENSKTSKKKKPELSVKTYERAKEWTEDRSKWYTPSYWKQRSAFKKTAKRYALDQTTTSAAHRGIQAYGL